MCVVSVCVRASGRLIDYLGDWYVVGWVESMPRNAEAELAVHAG